MVTMVGLNSNPEELVKELLTLEFDALAAYHASVERFEDIRLKSKFEEFIADHNRHVSELTALARKMGVEAPDGPDAKALLTKGKVAFAGMIGDRSILAAMVTNEMDTTTAYERASKNKDVTPEAREIYERAYADERRHKSWMSDTIDQLPDSVSAA